MALTQISENGVKTDAITHTKLGDDCVGAAELVDSVVSGNRAVMQNHVRDDIIDEARLQISNAGTNGQFLQKQSGDTGGLTWATVTVPDSDKIEEGNTSIETTDTGSDGHVKIKTEGTTRVLVDNTGRVGIGFQSFNDSAEQLLIGSTTTAANLSIVANNSDHSSLNLGDEDDFNIQKIKSDHTDNSLQFFTDNNEKFRFGSSGQLGIGGATYGTSGQVLTSQGASSAPQWADATSAAMGYDMWCVDAQFPAANGWYREWDYTEAWGSAQTFTADGGSGADSGGPGPATMSITRCTTSQNPLFAKVGTGMSMSAGVWTFPNTGQWKVTFAPVTTERNSGSGGHNLYIWTTTDNGSNWHDALVTFHQPHDSMWNYVSYSPTSLRLNITDTSNQKVKFSMGGGDGRTRVFGYSDRVASRFIFEQIS